MFEFKPIATECSENITMKKNSYETLISSKVKISKIENLSLKRINSVKEIIKLPKKNYQYRLITQKAFTSTDFLKWVYEEEGATEINIAVYRMNQHSVHVIKSMIDIPEIKINIILSSFFKTSKKAEVWHDDLVMHSRGKPNINIFYCVNHAKIICVRTDKNWYVIEGSGNMSNNARIEQYTIDNSEDVYNFHSDWIKELTNG